VSLVSLSQGLTASVAFVAFVAFVGGAPRPVNAAILVSNPEDTP